LPAVGGSLKWAGMRKYHLWPKSEDFFDLGIKNMLEGDEDRTRCQTTTPQLFMTLTFLTKIDIQVRPKIRASGAEFDFFQTFGFHNGADSTCLLRGPARSFRLRPGASACSFN